jgi:uroporphyrinogen decarboxylase
VPIDYQSKTAIDRKLKEYYGISSERELLDILGCDFYYLSARDISQNETALPIYRGPELTMTDTERVCPFGIRFKRDVYNDKFGADEAIEGPLEKASSPQDILDHPWPEPNWFDVDDLLEECEAFSDKVIVGGFWSGILGDSYRMHGFENFLLNLAMKPEIIKTLVDRMTDFYLELNERTFSALKGKLDIYFFGNDFGSQKGLLFSEDMWDEFFADNYRKLCNLAHSYGIKTMAHSCGSIFNIIDRLIDTGVEILDPVQTTAMDMEPEKLKEQFGDQIVFHGAIDTQNILPKGSLEDVRRHAEDTIRVLGDNGGYIFVSCNSLQDDTPVENIDMMYKTAREYKVL